jgi:hypothetical protein
MKLRHHAKILRVLLLLPESKVKFEYQHFYDPERLPYGASAAFSGNHETIYFNPSIETDTFVLAHEMYHARQWKKVWRRKYWKAFENFKQLPETVYDDVWGFRRYKYQLLERQANAFALRYCFFMAPKMFRKYLDSEIQIFFLYFLGLKPIVDKVPLLQKLFNKFY